MPHPWARPDASGQALAYVYCRANEAEAMQAKVLTEHEAFRGDPGDPVAHNPGRHWRHRR
jgi:hypothetical protein